MNGDQQQKKEMQALVNKWITIRNEAEGREESLFDDDFVDKLTVNTMYHFYNDAVIKFAKYND